MEESSVCDGQIYSTQVVCCCLFSFLVSNSSQATATQAPYKLGLNWMSRDKHEQDRHDAAQAESPDIL